MTADKLNAAIAKLRARDGTAYRDARAAHHRASQAYDAAAVAVGEEGRLHYGALQRYVVAALAPHRIEWQNYNRETGHDVNGDDWTCSAHLYGEVWPEPIGGKYNMQMRAHFPFIMTPRDGDEFRRMVAALKGAADAMRDGGL